MKKNLYFSALLMVAAFLPAQGDLLRYTFSGNVTSAPLENTTSTVRLGDMVLYEFFVDTDLPGFMIDFSNNSSILEVGSTIDNRSTATVVTESFQAYFSNGALLSDPTGDDNTYLALGSSDVSATGTHVTLIGGSFSHFIQIGNNSASIDNWLPGVVVTGVEMASSTTSYAVIWSTLSLVSITGEPLNVPEPSALLLLLTGCLVFLPVFFLQRKRDKH